MPDRACPFCRLPPEAVLFDHGAAVVVPDRHPVSPGHLLVVARRHVQSWFDTTPDERAAILAALDQAHAWLAAHHAPAGHNLGLNDGPAAGQTIPHLHVHLIPRYPGDDPDPRFGVRRVLPGYDWTRREPVDD